MRPQLLFAATTLFAATVLFAVALPVNADSYSSAISACETEIGQRLGISDVNARYNIEKIKSRGRFKDIEFKVSVFDETHPVQSVTASCRTKTNGNLLAIEFDQESLPANIAIN